MKTALFLISTLFFSPKTKEIHNIPVEKIVSTNLCGATVASVTNSATNATVLSIIIKGCETSQTNILNLAYPNTATSFPPGFTCVAKMVRLKISGTFNTVKMYESNTLIKTLNYSGPLNLFYDFTTPDCAMTSFVVE